MSAHANRQRSSHAEWDKAYRIRVAGRLGNPELTQPCERGQYAQSIDKLRIMKSNNARLPPYWVLDGIEYSSHSKRDGSRRIIYTKKMRLFDSYEEAVAGIPHFLEAIKRDGVSITRMLDNAELAKKEFYARKVDSAS